MIVAAPMMVKVTLEMLPGEVDVEAAGGSAGMPEPHPTKSNAVQVRTPCVTTNLARCIQTFPFNPLIGEEWSLHY